MHSAETIPIVIIILNGTLTNVKLRNFEHFSPADHILPLYGELQRIRSLPGWDELGAQKPATSVTKMLFVYDI